MHSHKRISCRVATRTGERRCLILALRPRHPTKPGEIKKMERAQVFSVTKTRQWRVVGTDGRGGRVRVGARRRGEREPPQDSQRLRATTRRDVTFSGNQDVLVSRSFRGLTSLRLVPVEKRTSRRELLVSDINRRHRQPAPSSGRAASRQSIRAGRREMILVRGGNTPV